MKTLIVSGGWLRPAFLFSYADREKPDYVIAADRGMDALYAAGLVPDLIVGDYDSTTGEAKETYARAGVRFETYQAEKNFTDTEAALHRAVELGSTEITVLGATGGRLDHFLGNLYSLLYPLEHGVQARVVDEQNVIFLADQSFSLRKADAFGTYFSLLPLTEEVRDLSITGCKYPLSGAVMKRGTALGVSNEITGESARVSFSKGVLIVVCSRDAS